MTGEAQAQPMADVLARARLLGIQADREVGVRELLLALLADDPRGVMRAWRSQGLDGHRLVEAVKEWWPAQDGPVPVSLTALPLTAQAQAAVEVASRSPQSAMKDTLLRELLAVPTASQVLAAAAEGPAGGPPEAEPIDATATALSALALL
jgi:hypothetical protein